MDKLLKPAKLSIDPNSPSASKEWKHWVRTFRSYVGRYVSDLNEEEADRDKLEALVNCATPEVFEFFDECQTFKEAVETLEKLFVKKPNNIFARHLLQAARQKPDQTLADFRCVLVKLAKNCEFSDVSYCKPVQRRSHSRCVY